MVLSMSNICPMCERGELFASVVTETISYGQAKLVVPNIEISTCNLCGEELVLPEQAKRNDVRFADARRQHDGLMTSAEIVAWRQRHRMTQKAAGEIFGGGINAFSRYERGEVMQSRATDLLMRAADQSSIVRAMLFGTTRDGWMDDASLRVDVTHASLWTKSSVEVAANDDQVEWSRPKRTAQACHVN